MELTQKQSQRLSMTAAMRQSLELLQLPVCELAARLQDAALSNPLLEVELPAPETLPERVWMNFSGSTMRQSTKLSATMDFLSDVMTSLAARS